jgi:integrase
MICRKCKKEIDETPFCPLCGTKQETPAQKAKARGNGTGSVYKHGDTWVSAITIGKKKVDGKIRYVRKTKGGFKTKKDAVAYLSDLLNGTAEKKPRAVTLDSLWESYKNGPFKKLSANTQSAYKTARHKMDDIFFSDIRLINIDDLQRCVDQHAKTYDPAKDMQSVLSHCYNFAMAEQFVTVNLSKFITLPVNSPEDGIPFSEAEINSLWEHYGHGDKVAGYALLMIYSGMMPGELFKADKNMIDFDNQTIVGAGMKTKKRRSTPIVIADFMLPVLRDLCDYSQGVKLCFTSRDRFYIAFREMLTRCDCRPALTPYSCRHTTATLSALGNVAQSVLLEIMRQKKFTTTQRYIHIDVSKSLEAINTLKAELLKQETPE